MNEILNGIKVSAKCIDSNSSLLHMSNRRHISVVNNAKMLKGEELFRNWKQSHPPLLSLQILKLYAWEPSFQTQVEDIRNGELVVMKKFAYLTSVSTFIFSCAPALVSHAKNSFSLNINMSCALDIFSCCLLPPRCHWPHLLCTSQ